VNGLATIDVVTAETAEDAQRRAAGGLYEAGCRPGDRVAFCLPSSGALLCTALGALRSGVVPVLLNATLLPAERQLLVDDARPRITVTDRQGLDELALGRPRPLAPRPLSRPMHYTSGTTGRPKGVWAGLWDEATAAAAFADEADLWSFGPDDVHLVCSPMYHSVSIRFAAGTMLSGGTCVVLTRFDPIVARRALEGTTGTTGTTGVVPTTTFMAPAALNRLVETAGGDLSDAFANLRLLVHAGSPTPASLKHAALTALRPGALWEFYGSTEGQFTVCSPDEWRARPGTVGRARPGRTLTVDPDGTIWCRPPGFGSFRYWGDDEKTAAAWRDGFFTVGDLGRLDEDGYLFIDGRRDDLIISGGVNVYPAEVEAVLSEAEEVADVGVFGMPDDRWGERVCAALVPRGRRIAPDLADAVAAFAGTRLAPYKRPKQYVVVEDLPRTATGKLQRHRLRALLEAEATG
jgi:long-chain acyl-CoA synthetase